MVSIRLVRKCGKIREFTAILRRLKSTIWNPELQYARYSAGFQVSSGLYSVISLANSVVFSPRFF